MTEYMTTEEVAERERVIGAFITHVSLAEVAGDVNVSLSLSEAIEIRNELERLAEIEQRYDDTMSAAEDRRFD